MGTAEVIIIGGGISGLSLAYFLLQRNPQLDIKIIEATESGISEYPIDDFIIKTTPAEHTTPC
ncbi:MAG: FAD-dependent oxidoreductase, partial [Thermodesulfovibrio sp.]|nr:FAD-dependent oxidoreductase [Thermodesulfovibrio sp.]